MGSDCESTFRLCRSEVFSIFIYLQEEKKFHLCPLSFYFFTICKETEVPYRANRKQGESLQPLIKDTWNGVDGLIKRLLSDEKTGLSDTEVLSPSFSLQI